MIIPVYQGVDLIRDSIQSVLNQSWKNIEVIVVDDGSSDGTADVVNAIEDPRVHLIQQTNAGASRARNRGFEASSGTLIQFLDHDDLLSREKIERQVRRLQAEGMDRIACCAWERFDYDVAHSHRAAQPVWRDDDPFDWQLSVHGGGGMMPTGTWLTPRPLIEQGGPWDESLPGSLGDDGEFFSRAVLASRRVLYCDDAVLYYRNAVASNLRLARAERHVRALLLTQGLYEKRFLSIEDSPRVRRTVAHGYATFLEMVYPAFPGLCGHAFDAIKRLGVSFSPPGSRAFALVSNTIGLRSALMVRRIIRAIFGRPLLGGLFLSKSDQQHR